MSAAADRAVAHVLRQMQGNPRLAYYIGPFSESYELLTAARAEAIGADVGEFRSAFEVTLKTEAPPKPY